MAFRSELDYLEQWSHLPDQFQTKSRTWRESIKLHSVSLLVGFSHLKKNGRLGSTYIVDVGSKLLRVEGCHCVNSEHTPFQFYFSTMKHWGAFEPFQLLHVSLLIKRPTVTWLCFVIVVSEGVIFVPRVISQKLKMQYMGLAYRLFDCVSMLCSNMRSGLWKCFTLWNRLVAPLAKGMFEIQVGFI